MKEMNERLPDPIPLFEGFSNLPDSIPLPVRPDTVPDSIPELRVPEARAGRYRW
jgi:hypothetical protein